MIGVHVREYWLYGLFFAIVAPLQAVWGVLLARGSRSRSLLVAGVVGNGAVIAVWLTSRLAGLPFGPAPFEPEAIGLKDVLATYDQFAVVVLCLLLLRGAAAPSWLTPVVWVLVAVSALAAFLPGH